MNEKDIKNDGKMDGKNHGVDDGKNLFFRKHHIFQFSFLFIYILVSFTQLITYILKINLG